MFLRSLVFAALLTGSAVLADQVFIRAKVLPANERKAFPAFSLTDASGKPTSLDQYRGKVVLLDFWATWCGGCKQEIPFFVEFNKQYAARGLAVVGVSLDDGWKVLKPWLEAHPIPYRIVLGNDNTAKQFGIEGMPDTFLIDQQGRIAAAYRAGVVDKADMETNIKTLLAAH